MPRLLRTSERPLTNHVSWWWKGAPSASGRELPEAPRQIGQNLRCKCNQRRRHARWRPGLSHQVKDLEQTIALRCAVPAKRSELVVDQ